MNRLGPGQDPIPSAHGMPLRPPFQSPAVRRCFGWGLPAGPEKAPLFRPPSLEDQRIPFRPTQHAQAQYFEFLDYLGLKDYSGEWNIRFTEQELVWRKDFFEGLGRPAVSFVVSTSNPNKDWHAGGYARVIDYIDKNLDFISSIEVYPLQMVPNTNQNSKKHSRPLFRPEAYRKN